MKILLFQESYILVIILLFLFILFKRFYPLFIIIFLFLLYFYRFPERSNHYCNKIIVSPADGTVSDIQQLPNGYKRVIIFLSPLNVHIQWTPVKGTITDLTYKKGSFHPAFLFKKSDYNERMVTTISTNRGNVYVRQIAGILARRIVHWLSKNQQVDRGTPMGMIKLSSRVDIDLPPHTSLLIKKGDHVKGNETKLAIWL
tara:strand:- start:863 stop:1462 length:600 start_codon:yes stop_codon:yes gene_type:complete